MALEHWGYGMRKRLQSGKMKVSYRSCLVPCTAIRCQAFAVTKVTASHDNVLPVRVLQGIACCRSWSLASRAIAGMLPQHKPMARIGRKLSQLFCRLQASYHDQPEGFLMDAAVGLLG